MHVTLAYCQRPYVYVHASYAQHIRYYTPVCVSLCVGTETKQRWLHSAAEVEFSFLSGEMPPFYAFFLSNI